MLQRRVSPAKKYARRTLQVIALIGTLLIGIIALALIASQTPWFRDWLRKYTVRQAGQYIDGTVSVSSLSGNLFTGIELGDIAIDVNGEHVITLKRAEVKYSIGQLISNGITVQEIRLEQPFVLLRHDANGWNVSRLVKEQAQEADRTGPGRPLSMPNIEIIDGRVTIDDRAPSDAYTLPKQIQGLNAKAGYEYAPVHYSVTLDRFQFTASDPNLVVQQLSGRLATRDDNLNIEKLSLRTADSQVTIDGAINSYAKNPSLQVTVTSPRVSLPELAGVLPSVRGYNLHPSLDLKANGRQDALQLDLNAKSEAGAIAGKLTADVLAPNYAARGDLNVQDLNLAPLLKDPKQKSDIPARAAVDVTMATAPSPAPVLERLRGHVRLDAPSVVAAGYAASDVRVTADLQGRRIDLDGRANAYGGAASARGVVVPPAKTGDPLQFDLTGAASHLNLSKLPRSLNAPRVATDLNATQYHVKGSAGKTTTVDGTVTMGQSTIAGGTITNGTNATFGIVTGARGLQTATYAA